MWRVQHEIRTDSGKVYMWHTDFEDKKEALNLFDALSWVLPAPNSSRLAATMIEVE